MRMGDCGCSDIFVGGVSSVEPCTWGVTLDEAAWLQVLTNRRHNLIPRGISERSLAFLFSGGISMT